MISRQELKQQMLSKMESDHISVAELARRSGVKYDIPRDFFRRESSMPAADKMMPMLRVLGLSHLLAGITHDGFTAIPVIGEVPGGDCREAMQLPVEMTLFYPTRKTNVFALRVKGNSVNRIAPDGSYAIIDASQTDPATLNNQLVVVCINRAGMWDSTCKIYRSNPDRFEPFSTDHHDTIFPGTDEWRICGKVVGAISFAGESGKLEAPTIEA